MKELLLTASATELQALLQSGNLTSVQLVKACLNQIAKYDRSGPPVRAIVSAPPEEHILSVAERLDKERAAGKVRGPLHGVQIIVKDSINTAPSLGMLTTLGSYAFETSRPKSNSVVVQMQASRGDNITSGWSALNAQTQSAYIQGGVKHREMRLGHTALGGSSSGSAVGVSAGYSPISIGTEADGSLSTPASCAALYAMKPSVGSTPMDGIFVISTAFDTVGAMAKSVADLATLIEYVQEKAPGSNGVSPDYGAVFQRDWSGLRLGFVDPDKWWLPPALVTPIEEVKHADYYEPRGVVTKYLETRDDPNMKSLEDIAKFNIEHADLELPEGRLRNQNAIHDALNHNITLADYEEAKATLQKEALENGVLRVMEEGRLDAIVGPTDGPLAAIAAAIGGPIATMPVGLLNLHGRPFGLSVIALPKHDDVLFKVMSDWEATFPKRAVPPLLLEADANI